MMELTTIQNKKVTKSAKLLLNLLFFENSCGFMKTFQNIRLLCFKLIMDALKIFLASLVKNFGQRKRLGTLKV